MIKTVKNDYEKAWYPVHFKLLIDELVRQYSYRITLRKIYITVFFLIFLKFCFVQKIQIMIKTFGCIGVCECFFREGEVWFHCVNANESENSIPFCLHDAGSLVTPNSSNILDTYLSYCINTFLHTILFKNSFYLYPYLIL